MAQPATNWFKTNLISNPWKKAAGQVDLDGSGLKLAFFLGANISGSFNFDTDAGYAAAPWNAGEVTSTGTSIVPAGGFALTSGNAPTITVDTSGHTVCLVIPSIILNSGSMANFDTLLIYDSASATPSNAGIAAYNLGATPFSYTSPATLAVDFQNTPITDTALWAS